MLGLTLNTTAIHFTQLNPTNPLTPSFRQAKRARNLNAAITTRRFQTSWNDMRG